MSDPFALLGLDKTYALDLAVLDTAYFCAQKKTHPDQFTHASAEERAKASQHSALLNQAYALLKDPLTRAEALLNDASAPLPPDSSFLERLMQWREQAEAGEDICETLLSIHRDLLNELGMAFERKETETAHRVLDQLRYVQGMLR